LGGQKLNAFLFLGAQTFLEYGRKGHGGTQSPGIPEIRVRDRKCLVTMAVVIISFRCEWVFEEFMLESGREEITLVEGPLTKLREGDTKRGGHQIACHKGRGTY